MAVTQDWRTCPCASCVSRRHREREKEELRDFHFCQTVGCKNLAAPEYTHCPICTRAFVEGS